MSRLLSGQQQHVSDQTPWYLSTAPIATSLAAYWKLDETSGNRAATISSITLTDTNTVTGGTGIVYPTAASFAYASAERLVSTDDATLRLGNVDWWIAVWARRESGTASSMTILKKGNGPSDFSYRLYYESGTSRYRLSVSNDGTTAGTIVEASNFGAPNFGQWHFLFVSYNAATDTLSFSVNGGTANTGSHASGAFDSATDFRIGGDGIGGEFNGLIGPVAIGKNYVPTSDDIAFLYNGGFGRR